MKLNGSYTFQASCEQIFRALLDPVVLKATIPGCEGAWYSQEHGHMKIRLVTPVPGLEGPFDITIDVLERDDPHRLVIRAGRNGDIGGKINTVTEIILTDIADGAALTYEMTAELSGPVAAVDNPLFIGIARHTLKTFFKRMNLYLRTES